MRIGSPEWSDLIVEGAAAFDIDLTPSHTRQFAIHATELIKWNQKINITAITDSLEIAVKHFLDSLAVARFITPGATLLDIGSGGGFPGLPLKVFIPSLDVTLIDASRKKVNFLKQVVRILKLDHTEALHIRAEELARNPQFSQRYNVILSRALSSLELFHRLAWPLIADKGVMLALKGEVSNEELTVFQDRQLAGSDHNQSMGMPFSLTVENIRLPVLNVHRSIVVIRKTD